MTEQIFEEYIAAIAADQRFRIFDVVTRPRKINFMFAGKKMCKLVLRTHKSENYLVVTNGIFGRKIDQPEFLYERVSDHSGSLGAAIRDRNRILNELTDRVTFVDSLRNDCPYLTRAELIKCEAVADAVSIGQRRFYCDKEINRYPTALETLIRNHVQMRLVARELPQPIAEEIAECLPCDMSELSRYGISHEQFEHHVESCLNGSGAAPRTRFHKKLERYMAAEAEIAELYPRAAKILPPILFAAGYYAGADMPGFRAIEDYLEAKGICAW